MLIIIKKKSINIKDIRHSHGIWHNGRCQIVSGDNDRFCTICHFNEMIKSICFLGYEKAEGKKSVPNVKNNKRNNYFMKQYIKFLTDDGFIVN